MFPVRPPQKKIKLNSNLNSENVDNSNNQLVVANTPSFAMYNEVVLKDSFFKNFKKILNTVNNSSWSLDMNSLQIGNIITNIQEIIIHQYSCNDPDTPPIVPDFQWGVQLNMVNKEHGYVPLRYLAKNIKNIHEFYDHFNFDMLAAKIKQIDDWWIIPVLNKDNIKPHYSKNNISSFKEDWTLEFDAFRLEEDAIFLSASTSFVSSPSVAVKGASNYFNFNTGEFKLRDFLREQGMPALVQTIFNIYNTVNPDSNYRLNEARIFVRNTDKLEFLNEVVFDLNVIPEIIKSDIFLVAPSVSPKQKALTEGTSFSNSRYGFHKPALQLPNGESRVEELQDEEMMLEANPPPIVKL